MDKPICSIVILSFNQLYYTKQCLESIRKYTTDVNYEIIIVDNASDKDTIDFLETLADIILIKNTENFGFAGGCNQGIEASHGKYIMLLNNDTIVTKRWLFNMVQFLEKNEQVSMTGPLTNATVGKQMIQVPYGEDLEKMQEFAERMSDCDMPAWRTLRLVAFCILVRKSLFEEIGFLDTDFQIGNYEDDDFNIRALKVEKKAYVCRNAYIHHFMNLSFLQKNIAREKIMLRNKLLLEKKWQGMNWNHHAVYNRQMLGVILEQGGKDILQIGCGLGALAIELKEQNSNYRIVGIEDHPLRREIAKQFADEVYEWDKDFVYLRKMGNRQFDCIIIECMIEKSGLGLLEQIKPFLKSTSLIMLRVFNVSHITTIERIVTGGVEGNLLCASSEEFNYYYRKDIRSQIEQYGYEVIELTEVKKSLSAVQEKLMEQLAQNLDYGKEGRIYNRIYQMRLREGAKRAW